MAGAFTEPGGRLMKQNRLAIIFAFCAGATPAMAQTAQIEATPAANAMVQQLAGADTAWMLVATSFVLLMTIPGLALFYGGMVRKKNVLATMMHSFSICCLVSILWYIVGYSLSFSGKYPFIGDLAKSVLMKTNVTDLSSVMTTIPEYLFVTFQMAFAVITPALISGAFAERIKFSAMLLFSAAWSLLVYAPICHWIWGGGFLSNDGVLDFAGGTVIHVNAGVAGLVTACVIGRRQGHGSVNMAPHNLALSMTGAALLWIGWFGFNAGSAGGANPIAALALINTQLAASSAALAWILAEWCIAKKPSVLGLVSGAVAGLIAVTPAAGFVQPGGALIIGLIAGPLCYLAAVHLKKALGYDDALDAFGVHGVGGLVGALLTAVFASPALFADPEVYNKVSVLKQAYGLLISSVYCAVVTLLILFVINRTLGLRPTKQQEMEGLDLSQHGEAIQ